MGFQREQAYQKIQTAILNGDLRPGERLIEKEICEAFQIGRTPLREVLKQLEGEGYLDIVSNKGAVVRRVSVKDAEQIYDILALLEGYAVETAIPHMKPENESELRIIQNGCKKAARAKDTRMWLEENALFHEYFSKLTGNIYLYNQIEGLRKRLYQYRLIAVRLPAFIEKHILAHDMVLREVFKKDAKKARNAMRKHVLYVKGMVMDLFKQYPGV